MRPLELVVVWVVDYTNLDAPRVPVEGIVAAGTPHLGATTNLEDERATTRTRLGVFFKEGDGLDIGRIARVVVITPVLDFVAVFANIVVTDFAFPLGGQKTTTILNRTLANKRLLLRMSTTACGSCVGAP